MKTQKPSNSAEVRELPAIILSDVVPIPGLVVPLYVAEEEAILAVEAALEEESDLVLIYLEEYPDEGLTAGDIKGIGGAAQILHSVHRASGEYQIRVHVQSRVKISSVRQLAPFVRVSAKYLEDSQNVSTTKREEAFITEVKERFEVYCNLNPGHEEHNAFSQELFNIGALADLVGSVCPFEPSESQRVLETLNPYKRLEIVNGLLTSYLERSSIQQRILQQAKDELSIAQQQELLREQMRQIRAELGEAVDEEEEIQQLNERFEKLKIPPPVKREAEKQLKRLVYLQGDSSEAALVRTYLDWILDLPWSKRTKDRLEIKEAKEILDEQHYGLAKTKERILDFLAVRKLRKGHRGPVLLFVGPPGVGKTSLGKSIASALGRKFVRVSLGGLRDPAELRGHRRTYVGALPGRIIQGLKNAGTKNPVFMLDELDKIGADFRGDPASVLLEVLDPEQNSSFEDHYLNLPFDLSEVMFIGTANVTDTIPEALADRLEIIEISGYTMEEKVKIAERYMVPRAKDENGLAQMDISLSPSTIEFLIDRYTRESGVRELGRLISSAYRKVARKVAEEEDYPREILPEHVEEYLGSIKYSPDKRSVDNQVGVSTGLAWTAVGGVTLTVEVSITKGQGKLSLTGQLGPVMQESGQAALTYVQACAEELGVDPDFFEKSHVHIHVPDGAIPKDGPSAGTAIATALVSALTGKAVSRDVAMTGEITLRGNVLKIGGLKEKALAALRVGIPNVIIPKDNHSEIREFPRYLLDRVKFIEVESLNEVLDAALVVAEAGQPAKIAKDSKKKPKAKPQVKKKSWRRLI